MKKQQINIQSGKIITHIRRWGCTFVLQRYEAQKMGWYYIVVKVNR